MIYNLSNPPAFGFETKSCNAEERYWDNYICTSKSPEERAVTKFVRSDLDPRKMYRDENLLKVAGYIPLIGTIVGIIRLVLTNINSKLPEKGGKPLANKYKHITRGCIELTSCGFLLLIPDLIVTAHRALTKKPQLII